MNNLEYYARNMHVWPGNDTNNVIKTLRRNPNGPGVTKDQWLAERARLQNKPSWDDAPDWAMWLCQTSKGDWFFCESKQKPNADKGWDDVDDNDAMQCMDSGEVLGDWRDTLERRPEIDIDELIDTLSEDEWNKKSVSKLTRSVEWKQGELPPVGMECESHLSGSLWEIGCLTYIGNNLVVWKSHTGHEYATRPTDRVFRPLRTEEEKAVEEMIDIINMHYFNSDSSIPSDTLSIENWESYLKALYRAGLRFTIDNLDASD